MIHQWMTPRCELEANEMCLFGIVDSCLVSGQRDEKSRTCRKSELHWKNTEEQPCIRTNLKVQWRCEEPKEFFFRRGVCNLIRPLGLSGVGNIPSAALTPMQHH